MPEKQKLIGSHCEHCGGEVIYTSNAILYGGRTFGSGMCYYCTKCHASVGTHVPRPKEPYGRLATKQMQNIRKMCHNYFDKSWKSGLISRGKAYTKLSNKLGIDKNDCHFGYFDLETLQRAFSIVQQDNWWA